MSANDRRLRRLSTTLTHLYLAKRKTIQGLAFTTALLAATCGFAQQAAQTTPDSSDGSQKAATNNAITVPAGTRIALVLTQPIQTRYVHRGDDVYAQIVSPVTSGNDVVIPPGTFVQGKVDKLERKGGRGELRLQSMAITFPDGYTMPIAGPMTLESNDGYALKDPGPGRTTGAFALPAAGAGIGALIGHSTANSQLSTITSTLPPGCTGPPPGCLSSSVTAPGSTAKGTIIGAGIGGAVGAVASLALLLGTHNFFLDVGSPVEMVLQQPLSLKQDEVAEAIRDAIRETEQHPGPSEAVVQRPRATPPPVQDNGPTFCETPGTPGTPDIDIPGTPAIGDSPGTPPIHIPGIPATPPTTHLCP
jgi:hypothetical protein